MGIMRSCPWARVCIGGRVGDVSFCGRRVRFLMKGLIGTADGEGWVWDFLTLWAIRVVLGTCGWDLRGHAAGAGVLIPLKTLHLLSLFPSDFVADVDQSIHSSWSMSNMAQSSRSSHFPPSSTLGPAVRVMLWRSGGVQHSQLSIASCTPLRSVAPTNALRCRPSITHATA